MLRDTLFVLLIFVAISFSKNKLPSMKIEQTNKRIIILDQHLLENNQIRKQSIQSQKFDIEYVGILEIGNPAQKIKLFLDTGSHQMVILASSAKGVGYAAKYDSKDSKTFNYTQPKSLESLQYGLGYVQGYHAYQNVKFLNITLNYQFLQANYQKQFQTSNANGIMGLGSIFYQNFFDRAMMQNKLSSNIFAMDLRRNHVGESSYLYYDFKESDFPNVHYIQVNSILSWQIPLQGIKVNDSPVQTKSQTQSIIIDSGSSHLFLQKKIYEQIRKKYLQPNCNKLPISRQPGICDCDLSKYPNITFVTSRGYELVIPPDLYITEMSDLQYCFVFIGNIQKMNQNVIGIPIFHRYTIVFDKENNRIGFQDHYRPPIRFISDYFIINITKFLLVVAITASIGLFYGNWYNQQKNNRFVQRKQMGPIF